MKKILLSSSVFLTIALVLPLSTFAAELSAVPGISISPSALGKKMVFLGDKVSAQPVEVRAAKFGDKGTSVTAIQKVLISKGYLKAEATGYYGSQTKKAVLSFQKANNIAAVGQVGPMTLTAFSNLCTVTDPCNTLVEIAACPQTWMNYPFHDSYHRNVSYDGYPDQDVCDYDGSVTQTQCDAESAISTKGPHGVWCQKFINNDSLLLSIVRTSDMQSEPVPSNTQ